MAGPGNPTPTKPKNTNFKTLQRARKMSKGQLVKKTSKLYAKYQDVSSPTYPSGLRARLMAYRRALNSKVLSNAGQYKGKPQARARHLQVKLGKEKYASIYGRKLQGRGGKQHGASDDHVPSHPDRPHPNSRLGIKHGGKHLGGKGHYNPKGTRIKGVGGGGVLTGRAAAAANRRARRRYVASRHGQNWRHGVHDTDKPSRRRYL